MADATECGYGIALCHFAMIDAELGRKGEWPDSPPSTEMTDPLTDYIASWVKKD